VKVVGSFCSSEIFSIVLLHFLRGSLVLVGKIIKLNKERELKEQLFKQTVDQLKKTFEKNDLDKLQNLYFDFESDDIDTELDTEIELTDEQDGQEPTDTELVQ